MIKDPELLKLAVKAIEAEPQRWNQGVWNWTTSSNDEEEGWGASSGKMLAGRELQDMEHCGTTLCLAGHVVVQAGQIPLAGQQGYGQCIDPATGRVSSIMDKAVELLGLSNEQTASLFFGGPTRLSEFKRHVTKVTGVVFE